MEILTYRDVYQLVDSSESGTNECITKFSAISIADAHKKNVTSDLSQYTNNEYIDVFTVADKPDLSAFSFADKSYSPQASGGTYTTSVTSRDADGDTIIYAATADVDWITNIVINGTQISFEVSENTGDQRTGHITGSNATGKSDTITITQEAKTADVTCTYTLVATLTSTPTHSTVPLVFINDNWISKYSYSGNVCKFKYTVNVRTESEAPQIVNFSVREGEAGESYSNESLTVSPKSWDLNDGLSKQFTVDYSRVKTTKTWDRMTGTISRNSTADVKINTSTTTEHPTIDYTIMGSKWSYTKDGMKFTSTASSINDTGSISVQYNELTAPIDVVYNRPPEEFPDDAQHRWIRVQPESSQIPVDGGTINVTGSYGLTGSYGTEKKVGDITDTIVIESNPSQDPKSGSKIYYYNNNQFDTPTAEITWTQPGRSEEFPEQWTYVFEYNISDTNGGSSTDTSWSRQYYANGQEIKHDDDFTLDGIASYRTKTGTFGTVQKEDVQYSGQIGRPSGYNYSDQEVTENGRLVQDGSNKELQWSYTQEANVKVWGISADPTSLHFEADGGTQSVSVTTWYTWQTNDNNNQKFEETTTQEEITAEANTSTQQKEWTETITKNGKSVSINCTQDGKPVVLNVKYHLYVGLSVDNINDNTVSLVWQSDQHGESSKKTVYVNAYKEFINEYNQVVSTETVEYNITSYASQSKFSVNKNDTLVDFYPLEENTDYSSSKEVIFRVSITGQKNKFCTIQLIQERKGIQIISGDAVMFTYNWDSGKDLDQATYVNLNSVLDSSKNNWNYAGYKGTIISDYQKFLYFAGDNTGLGNEYSFIDFESISKYLNEHGGDESTVDGKTVLQSLTNENGIISIQCNLYTNWYGVKEKENIRLSYSVYNKDSEDASIESKDKQFILTGYTKKSESEKQALCYSYGGYSTNYDLDGPSNFYTLSAKFIYYFNSGVFAFDTNKDNVGKWQKGVTWETENTSMSYSSLQFTNDGTNVYFAINIDSTDSTYANDDDMISCSVYFTQTSPSKDVYIKPIKIEVGKLPYRINFSVPINDFIGLIKFGDNSSAEIYPNLWYDRFYHSISEDKMIATTFSNKYFVDNTVTIQKQGA